MHAPRVKYMYMYLESTKRLAFVHSDNRIVVLNAKEVAEVGRKQHWQLLLLMPGVDSFDDCLL